MGLVARSFVLRRRVTVHLDQPPCEGIGGNPTYLATCSGWQRPSSKGNYGLAQLGLPMMCPLVGHVADGRACKRWGVQERKRGPYSTVLRKKSIKSTDELFLPSYSCRWFLARDLGAMTLFARGFKWGACVRERRVVVVDYRANER